MRVLIAFICLLCSFTAIGQKMYKFQDENGHWKFTDIKPKTTEKIEVMQMDIKQSDLRFFGEENNGITTYFAENKTPAPMSVSVNITLANNAFTNPVLPQTFTIEKYKKQTLFQAIPTIKNKSWEIKFTYNYWIGPELANEPKIENYSPPIKGSYRISQGFNGKFSHNGLQDRYAVDIEMPIGTPIYAAREGTVISVKDFFYKRGLTENFKHEGNDIMILHDDGTMSIYAHIKLESAQVRTDLKVKTGQLLAYSGNNGYSSGPHLHFAVLYNNGKNLLSIPFKFNNQEPMADTWIKN